MSSKTEELIIFTQTLPPLPLVPGMPELNPLPPDPKLPLPCVICPKKQILSPNND
jgi:hypothetical protein